MNVMLDQIISTEVSAAVNALFAGRSSGKTIWVENGQPSDLDAVFAEFAGMDGVFFRTTLPLLDRNVFGPIRQLLQQTRAIWSQWEWVEQDYFREVNGLFPNTYEGKQSVFHVSYSWSELRLNRDIQWGFRLMHFAALVLKELAQVKPLVIAIHDVQHADRLSLQTLYHLLHNLKADGIVLILQKGTYDHDGRPVTSDTGQSIEKLLCVIADALQPLRLIGSKTAPVPAPALALDGDPPVDHIRAMIGELQNGFWDAEAIKKKLDGVMSVYSLDNVLTLGDAVLAHLPELSAEDERAIRFHVWRKKGVALAFMEMYPEAIHAFTLMHDYAGNMADRTKAYHLLALCYGKRVGRWDIAKQFLHEGLRITEGRSDFDTVYERCWLYNFLAYVTYLHDRDIPLALEYANSAYEGIKPFSHMTKGNVMKELEDPKLPLRLFYNLSINISYLHYFAKDYEAAKDLWQNTVGESVKDIPDIFKKEFFYFDGNILNRLGEYEDAVTAYQRTYEICVTHADSFNAEIALRPLASTYFQMERYEDALHWYERILQLKRETGDLRLTSTYQSIILCHLKLGHVELAQSVFQEAQELLPPRFAELFVKGTLAAHAAEFLEYGPYIINQSITQMII
ncbi:tetratricopeptide (TPR) repeat protein [Tumebacillus sp. BK434]|uniref:tetratricopeptide repeat protein n=1 Tax=Tumebacillus sp. BK434 TaxID=2512169 RepID=UPI001042994D|nr:tetratricopeptide repeat protein [Tumebacillus sp. BK434]TCP53859.1 tetratricopeptide (TPR) repeat protein [Tumebacillus sp. BK434]